MNQQGVLHYPEDFLSSLIPDPDRLLDAALLLVCVKPRSEQPKVKIQTMRVL
jgi:hypothetical protein